VDLDLLCTWLNKKAKLAGYCNARVVVEPTGIYHELLFRVARRHGFETTFVSAEAASKLRFVIFGDYGKTDRRDPIAIAELARRGHVLRHRAFVDTFAALRSAGILYARAERAGITSKCRIHRALRRVFPDFDFSPAFLFGRSGRAVFHCTGLDPHRITRVGTARLTKKLKRLVPRIRNTSVQRLVGAAKGSKLSTPDDAAHRVHLLDLRQAWDDLERAEKRKAETGELLMRLYDEARSLDCSLPAPPKGLCSKLNLARLIAETGPLSDFHGWRELLKYLGLNLCEKQSGRWRGRTRISKKGRTLARHVLSQMVVPLVRKDRLLGAYYHHKRDIEKKPGPVAITAAARKLVKIIWGWSRSGREFDVARVFACDGELRKAA
jgi:transposase